MTQWITNGRLFDGERCRDGMSVAIDDGRIGAVIEGPPEPVGTDSIVDLDGHLLAPGFVDLQVNGGGGKLFNDLPDCDTLACIAAAHRRFGTTALFPTLISDNADVMAQAVAAVGEALSGKVSAIAGLHFEGPHLAARYKGVHDEQQFRPLTDDAMALLTGFEKGRRIVTIAPETVPSAQISRLAAAGVIVCAGHSAADSEQTQAALAAGVSGFTHLFNAMPPFLSREPGMVGAALADRDSFIGLIADGYHLHPLTLQVAIAAKARGKAVLVTDAMPVVGSDNRQFDLHGETIEVRDGRCVTADGRLAGSAIGMIDAVRNAISFGGVPLEEALRMASLYPATAVGLQASLGRIAAGYRACMIEMDADLVVRRNWIDGDCEEYA